MRFDSDEQELKFLRAVHRAARMADEVIEDCLERALGLDAALDVILSSCAQMMRAEAGYVELVGTEGPVLARTFGRPGIALEKIRLWDGAVVLENGNTMVVAKMSLGSVPMGLLALELRGAIEGGARLPVALVETMAEQLDNSVLAFLALAEGSTAAERLDELNQSTAFRPKGRIGKYELVTPLGTGGMAQVLVARTRGPEGVGRLVALKRILPHLTSDQAMVDQFLDEAKIGMRLSHPNLVTFFDFGEAAGAYFIAMELVRGIDVSEVLRVQSPLEPQLAAAILAQGLEGLHAAHEVRGDDGLPLSLVHRDLSPQNLMLGFDGRVKVLDFGVAKSRIRRHLTIPGLVKGKPIYMSPEQAAGERLDRRSDLFAAGLILHELLTGKRAFEKLTDTASMEAIVNDPVSRHPSIPLPLWDVVERALQKDPQRRYRTAREMAAAIRDVAHVASDIELARFVCSNFPERLSQYAEWDRTSTAKTPTRGAVGIEAVPTDIKRRA
ncbi:MAG: serine/threonine-protein kinase [Myxococcaceae bacterium]